MLGAFQAAVNPMSGAIEHLPCDGGVLDQPMKTLQVWTLLQGVWIECMPKDPIRGVASGG